MKLNEYYQKLPGSYLFSTIAKKVKEFQEKNPEADMIRLGIGDVTLPIAPVIIKAIHEAVEEMGNGATFHGYAPDLGYSFLRETIAREDYQKRNCSVEADEIFISDGAKSDCGNIQELFANDAVIAVCDPVYPVYVDSNVMAGRAGEYDPISGTWSNVIYLPCTGENHFIPALPKKRPDMIYLCNPSNPTGTTLTKEQLKVWVDYANSMEAVILYDAAYEAYITDPDVPHSIYEVDGARSCAVEFRSFSKNAGFTGMRLGFTVVPKDITSKGMSLHDMWARRHGTKYNGAPYIQQKAGLAVYSEEGQREVKEQVSYYLRNARAIYDGLTEAGYEAVGGINSPYVWLHTGKLTSWEFFDQLLEKACVVGTPGSGFGPSGEHYFRLTGFGTYENTIRAVERMKRLKRL
jgi:LL-diaminopimelate aminotransferase